MHASISQLILQKKSSGTDQPVLQSAVDNAIVFLQQLVLTKGGKSFVVGGSSSGDLFVMNYPSVV